MNNNQQQQNGIQNEEPVVNSQENHVQINQKQQQQPEAKDEMVKGTK